MCPPAVAPHLSGAPWLLRPCRVMFSATAQSWVPAALSLLLTAGLGCGAAPAKLRPRDSCRWQTQRWAELIFSPGTWSPVHAFSVRIPGLSLRLGPFPFALPSHQPAPEDPGQSLLSVPPPHPQRLSPSP